MSKDKVELLNTPYGQVAYETFRARRLAFADKSGIIEFLDDEGMTPYPVLLRPRRFGKSTFVQMLKCFYDLSYKDRYDEIFSTKKIYAENLASHNTYHVIYFNFSGISSIQLKQKRKPLPVLSELFLKHISCIRLKNFFI